MNKYKKLNLTDLLKIRVKENDIIKKLYDNPKLIWKSKTEKLSHFDCETILSKEIKSYKGIDFYFYPNYLDIYFRPHYYFNNNLHNANDFKISNCINIIKDFIQEFEIVDYSNFKVINIEYGLNILFRPYGKDLVTFSEYHKRNQFRNDVELPFSKKSYMMSRNGTSNNYKIVKLYCKGLQYPEYCDEGTLRLEIKSKRSKYIKTLGISNIKDLLNPSVYENMSAEILKVIDDLLILDSTITFNNLTIREQRKLKEYINPYTWFNTLQKGRNEFSRKKKRYFDLLNKTGLNIHTEFKKVITKKLEELFIKKNEKGAYFTSYLKYERDAYSIINIGRISSHLDYRKCLLTNIDISMQSEDSRLLSHTGLKNLYETKRKTYELIREKYLYRKYIDASFQIQIQETAHSIRDKWRYRLSKQQKLYPIYQTQLFDINYLLK